LGTKLETVNGKPEVMRLPKLFLDDEATASAWTVVSMKNDWKRIFAFE
jgi:hypothetical protein